MLNLFRSSLRGSVKANRISSQSTRQFVRLNTPAVQKLVFNQMLSKKMSTTPEKYEFQAETRKLLDIVTHSIYTDKEVFLRELISNASDALEKFRFSQVNGKFSNTDASPLEIKVAVDKENNTISIIDNGIGMTKEELVSYLGTIARSGSKQFLENLTKSGSKGDGDGIIGQFGVGFYASFMVSDKVTVESFSAVEGSTGNVWESDGSGEYTIATKDDIARGCKITLHLKPDCQNFADVKKIKDIVKKYSNFVSFPIRVDDLVVNSVTAIWAQDKNSVTEAQYNDFYKFISNAYDKPKYTLHFQADAPINLKALLFFPTLHTEKFGMGRMEPGVNLYSRKICIENKPADLLPSWLRFLKGVVDSEDLPLSISREKPQDSALLHKIREALTRKVTRFLNERLTREPDNYREWYKEFQMFLKEGICQDYPHQEQISKLLMFESSSLGEGELSTFDEYIARSSVEEKKIYYLIAPDRKSALSSPYYETFSKNRKEVLFLYNTIDDFVMSNLKTFNGRELVSAEDSKINFDESETKVEEEEKKDGEGGGSGSGVSGELPKEKAEELCTWIRTALDTRVREVKLTYRLSDSPTLITDHESGAMRRMMKMVDQANLGHSSPLPPQILLINPKHPVIVELAQVKENDEELAKIVISQLMDNALVTAGLMDDTRSMIPRLNELLLRALQGRK